MTAAMGQEAKSAQDKKGKTSEIVLSDEDAKLKSVIENHVETLTHTDNNLDEIKTSLPALQNLICTATSGMTSVPKPLKFLIPHFERLQTFHAQLKAKLLQMDSNHLCPENQALLTLASDVMSCISIVAENQDKLDMLRYKVQAMDANIADWGFEYVRGLIIQINKCYMLLEDDECDFTNLGTIIALSQTIVSYLMQHNAEAEAIDLLMEIERLDLIKEHTDDFNYEKICLYLFSCVDYVSEGEDKQILDVVLELYLTHKKYVEALLVCLKIGDNNRIIQLFYSEDLKTPSNKLVRKQLAHILAYTHNAHLILNPDQANADASVMDANDLITNSDDSNSDHADLVAILSNADLSAHFIEMAQELELMEAKTPEDVFKARLSQTSSFPSSFMMRSSLKVDSAAENLCSSIANGLVNCGFGTDRLILQNDTTSTNAQDKTQTTSDRATTAANSSSSSMEEDASDMESMFKAREPPKNITGWLYNNKEEGMLTAAASLGWIYLWDIDGGLSTIDPFIYSEERYVQAGALLACGVLSSRIHHDVDPAYSLLQDYLLPIEHRLANGDEDKNSADIPKNARLLQLTSTMGTGIAYAGTYRQDIKEKLLESAEITLALIQERLTEKTSTVLASATNATANSAASSTSTNASSGSANSTVPQHKLSQEDTEALNRLFEVLGHTYLALGTIFTGSSNPEITEAIFNALMQLDESVFHEYLPHTLNLPLGLALNLLGKQADVLTTLELLKCLPQYTRRTCHVLIDSCAYAGSNNVLKVQELLKPLFRSSGAYTSTEDDADDGSSPDHESPLLSSQGTAQFLPSALAVLGVGLVAMGEEVGAKMSLRMLTHFFQYGDPYAKKAVPLALALLHVSNPDPQVVDTLGKLSHDPDTFVAQNSILALGMIAAGTNNARVASMLRQLAVFYQRDFIRLTSVRIALGIVHLGKGTMSLLPFRLEGRYLSKVSLSAILSFLVACIEADATVLNKMHYNLFLLTPAIYPRMCFTVDEASASIKASIRVGQAVDVVGQVGKPRTITGFQTHTTPILLSVGEKAELASDAYLPLSRFLEGTVILQKNPDAKE